MNTPINNFIEYLCNKADETQTPVNKIIGEIVNRDYERLKKQSSGLELQDLKQLDWAS